MLKIEISGNTPLEALATITAFGLRCMGNADVYDAANRILEAEQAKRAAAANPQPVADLPPEPYVEEPPHATPAPQAATPKPEPKAAEGQGAPPALEEVREKGMAAARAHGQPAVKAILEGFGVSSMTNLAEADRVPFLEKLAELEGAGDNNA